MAETGGFAGRLPEKKEGQAGDDINAHLAHDRKQPADRGRRRAIGGRQPEIQRPHAGLDQERDAQNRRSGFQQHTLVGVEAFDTMGEVTHVQRAGHTIDEADADQEEQCRNEVDGDVMQPRLDALLAGTVQQQPIGGRQHHFEENEEIEEVAGQERAVDAHQHHLEQRMEMRAGLVPLGHGIDQRRNGKQRRQQHHQA
ncbi:hypothetical protein D3C87_754220 [compost metagenome]